MEGSEHVSWGDQSYNTPERNCVKWMRPDILKCVQGLWNCVNLRTYGVNANPDQLDVSQDTDIPTKLHICLWRARFRQHETRRPKIRQYATSAPKSRQYATSRQKIRQHEMSRPKIVGRKFGSMRQVDRLVTQKFGSMRQVDRLVTQKFGRMRLVGPKLVLLIKKCLGKICVHLFKRNINFKLCMFWYKFYYSRLFDPWSWSIMSHNHLVYHVWGTATCIDKEVLGPKCKEVWSTATYNW